MSHPAADTPGADPVAHTLGADPVADTLGADPVADTLGADPVADSPFQICGPLPTGVTVLEASAGTGKTFTIAALAARYVAGGTPLDELLLVTFTRMATGELRDRVRERLVSAELGLSQALACSPAGEHDTGRPQDVERDEVLRLLADGPPAQVEIRRRRLASAIAGFDAATIATTHGFCHEVLSGLGIAGDLEPGTSFVGDLGDLLTEVVDDLYLRRFHRYGKPPLDRAEAMAIARVAVENPAAPIEPAAAAAETLAAMRRRLAMAVRDELEQRKRRMAVMTYDDLLTRLRDTLSGPGGAAAGARLRARYRVVLVDEFQDTDPVQWEIMRRAFGAAGTTLVLIGDPKQAVYAFRGADVYAYLEAARSAGTRATLSVNWRSDQGLIDAYDAIFGGASLGHEGIVYRTVRAAEANQSPRLRGAPVGAPLRVRVLARGEPSVELTGRGYAAAKPARERIARDLAADIVRLLQSPAEIEIRSKAGAALRYEPIRPGHVAVLVRFHSNASLVREALGARGVPAVLNGAGSVFGTVPARDWLALLEAIERPTSSPRARLAALTPFLGWSAQRVAGADEDDWEQVHRRLHHWARVLRSGGVATLSETITRQQSVPARVLTTPDGERRLTDLRHVGQLLHGAATTESMGTTALTSWLRRRIAATEDEKGDEERSRRLESDAEAVQVLTIHRSKGLEFPIVYYPYLWDPGYRPDRARPVFFHDPDNGDARTIDVGLAGHAFSGHQRQHAIEERGEDLRLAYVALTRAKHQAIVWWAGSWDSRHSALGRLLFARPEDGSVPPAGTSTPSDAGAVARLQSLAEQVPGAISVERSIPGSPAGWAAPAAAPVELSVAELGRRLDLGWRRTSYTDITGAAGSAGSVGSIHEAAVASEPEERVLSDEPPAGVMSQPPEEGVLADRSPAAVTPGVKPGVEEAMTLMGTPSRLAQMPVGIRVGTFVHRLLEATDFAATDLELELRARMAGVRARGHVDVGDVRSTLAGLQAAIETSLGPLLRGVRLCDIPREDRLDELEFELPLAGGDQPSGRLTLAAIGAVLREHLPREDPLSGYAERLDDPGLRRSVRGYLAGSIDLVLRVPGARAAGADRAARFAVVDYKTNWLGAPGEELTAWHHRPAALRREMHRAHYGLQALLYTVALHRYLRWRLPGYDPERNLAGVLYLFLRGMTGAATPLVGGAPCGVFAWRPSKALVEALSDVLDRGGAG